MKQVDNYIGNKELISQQRVICFLKMKMSNIQVLVEMAKKDRAGSNRFAPFWKVYLTGNPLSDAAKKVQLEELRDHSVADRIHFDW